MSDLRDRRTGPLRHRFVRLLVAAWIIAVLAIYFRLQIMRVLTMAGLLPEH